MLRLSDSGGESGHVDGPERGRTPDHDALDAYSRAVVGVVETAGPAVVALRGPRKGPARGGSGSGFLIAPEGFAVTNSHVVAGRAQLTAITSEGDSLDAAVIGDDPATDTAVVRLAARDLPAVRLADESPLRVGQLVVAMGSPFGLESTVSAGIVSATNRGMRGVDGRLIEGVVQHTAPINPGNSGGPLLDGRGQVVGVNTATIAFAQGVGFAVPASTVRWVVGEILAHGRVTRPTLGIAAVTVAIPRRIVRSLDLLNDYGVMVGSVDAASAAGRAGIREGDIIVEFEGRVVNGIDDLHRLVSKAFSGGPIGLAVVRDGSLERIELRL